MASASACCAGTENGITNEPQTSSLSGRDAADAARYGLPDPSDLADDPTLAGCCAEDLKNFRRAERLRNALLEVDPTMARLKLTGQVLPGPPPPAQPGQQGEGSPLELTDDDEDDPELVDLRARRLQELQRQAAERQVASSQGYGQLNDVPGAKLLATVEGVQGPAVVHVAIPGHEAGALLDEYLAVSSYLERLRVLRSGHSGPPRRPAGAQRRRGGTSDNEEGGEVEEDEEEEWRLKPCEGPESRALDVLNAALDNRARSIKDLRALNQTVLAREMEQRRRVEAREMLGVSSPRIFPAGVPFSALHSYQADSPPDPPEPSPRLHAVDFDDGIAVAVSVRKYQMQGMEEASTAPAELGGTYEREEGDAATCMALSHATAAASGPSSTGSAHVIFQPKLSPCDDGATEVLRRSSSRPLFSFLRSGYGALAAEAAEASGSGAGTNAVTNDAGGVATGVDQQQLQGPAGPPGFFRASAGGMSAYSADVGTGGPHSADVLFASISNTADGSSAGLDAPAAAAISSRSTLGGARLRMPTMSQRSSSRCGGAAFRSITSSEDQVPDGGGGGGVEPYPVPASPQLRRFLRPASSPKLPASVTGMSSSSSSMAAGALAGAESAVNSALQPELQTRLGQRPGGSLTRKASRCLIPNAALLGICAIPKPLIPSPTWSKKSGEELSGSRSAGCQCFPMSLRYLRHSKSAGASRAVPLSLHTPDPIRVPPFMFRPLRMPFPTPTTHALKPRPISTVLAWELQQQRTGVF
eukprot:XP_001698574.1 predicted protein [Chlamydomonas reinhardtii]